LKNGTAHHRLNRSAAFNWRLSLLVYFLLGSFPLLTAQTDSASTIKHDSTTLHPKRLTAVIVTQASLYAASLAGLYFAWYADYPQSSFHFFNDGNEWLQMDKVGHVTAAYYISRIGYASYRWAGLDQKRSTWFGGLLGFAYMANIEILDGFSEQWGFSPGDLLANTAGCFLFVGQQLGWHEQRFVMKYSFHQTVYPQYNPDLLGENLVQQLVKDYNGMTLWLSGNISTFLPKQSKFPKWLNVAVGYGVEGMTEVTPDSSSYRQFYLSLDVDLTRIKTRSKVLKGIFTVFSFIKIPFPTLEYNSQGAFKFHYLYF
jgi:hypothetical protein